MTAPQYGFFRQSQLSEEIKTKQTPYVWKNGGTFFHAFAILFCDTALLNNPFFSSQLGVVDLLKAYHALYPLPPTQQGTLLADFKAVLCKPGYPAVVCKQLAEILYHLTVKGLMAEPTKDHGGALPQEIREGHPNHWIEASAPAILAYRLKFSIKLFMTGPGKALHASRVCEHPQGYKHSFQILKKHHRYYARIIHQDVFKEVLPIRTYPYADPAILTKLVSELEAELERTVEKYDEVYDNIYKKVTADGISKTFLRDLYIHDISMHRPLGIQAFIDSIDFDSIDNESAEHSIHQTLELIEKLAGMCALGDIDKHVLYSKLSQEQDEEAGCAISYPS